MSQANSTELYDNYLLASLYSRHSDALGFEPFESENDRWAELAVSLLATFESADEAQAREVVDIIGALGILHPNALTQHLDNVPKDKILPEILRDHGFTAADASSALTLLEAVARWLSDNWEGHVQTYLRSWGERLLEDFGNSVSVTEESRVSLLDGISEWMQTALGVPLASRTDLLSAFAEAHGTSRERLIAAADRLSLNVALLDQAVIHEMGSGATPEA